jgi:hypothetical protein
VDLTLPNPFPQLPRPLTPHLNPTLTPNPNPRRNPCTPTFPQPTAHHRIRTLATTVFGQSTSTIAISFTTPYTALKPRAALASIARHLLRDVPLGADVYFQNSLHAVATGTSDAHSSPPSAPVLNTLTPTEQRQVVRTGAGVIVSTVFCNTGHICFVGCHFTGYLSVFHFSTSNPTL